MPRPVTLLLLAPLLCVDVTAAGQVLWQTKLTEYLGHHWTGELLHYDVSGERPLPEKCTLVVTDGTGAGGPVACQITDRSRDQETGRHTCRLYCVLDLKPYQKLKLELRSGNPPGKVAQKLGVIHTPDALTVSSGTLETQVPASVKKGDPLPEAEIPSPLLKMRNLEQQKWVGKGRFVNVGKLLSLETRVAEHGPVFVDTELSYHFEEGEYSVTLRVIRDQPVVLWTEQYKHANAGAALVWDCSAGMPLKSGVWDYGMWSAFRGRMHRGGLGITNAFPLEFDRPPATMTFEPWIHWAHNDLTTWLELWPVLPTTKDTVYEQRPVGEGPTLKDAGKDDEADDLLAGEDDLEKLEKQEKPKRKVWAVGIFMGNPLDWNPRSRGAYRASYPRMELTRGKQVLLRLPISRGQRTFGLSLAEKTPNERIGSNMGVGVADAAARQIKYGETPLDEVKDYVLDYDDDQPDTFPHLFLTEEKRLEYAKGLTEDAPYYGRIKRVLGDCRRLARTDCKEEAAQSLSWDLVSTSSRRPREDHVRAALACPDDSLKPFLQVSALAASRRFALHFFWHGTGPGMGIAPHNWLSEEYGFGMIDLASRHLTPEQFRRVRARMLFAAYKFASENYWAPHLGFGGTANMTTLVNGALGQIAMLYPNHPRAKDWSGAVEREVNRELTHWMGPNGGWLEAPHYMTVSMEPIIGFALAKANAGDPSILHSDRLKKTMLWLAKVSTPRDPRFQNRRHFPEIGHTYAMETSVLFTLIAKVHRDRDPAYADAMQWLWYEMGCPSWPGIGGAYPLTAGYREALADSAPRPKTPPAWGSELFPGSGALLRAHFATDRESHLYLIQGPMHQHYDRDRGSFMMWGKGRPLCLDWGYRGMMPASMHNRMEIGSGGKVTEFATQDRADYFHNVQSGWHRQVLFVKDTDPLGPNYFLIRDSTSGEGHANWRLWCNTAKHLPIEGQLVTARGRDDVDLDIWFDEHSLGLLKRIREPLDDGKPKAMPQNTADLLTPGEEKEPDEVLADLKTQEEQRPWVVETGEATVATPVIGYGGQWWGEGTGTTQRGLRLAVPKGQPVVCLLYPRLGKEPKPKITALHENRVLKIETSSGTDYALLALDPFEANLDNIRFQGKAAAVQIRGKQITLTLLAPGKIAVGDATLEGDSPASKTIELDR